jgi:phosphoheptose isomerase
MSTIIDRIKHNFTESIQIKINAADTLQHVISFACHKIVQCLLDGHKIMTCGNGSSGYDAVRFSSQMLNHFKYERPSLPVIALNADLSALTSTTNETALQDVFAKQIKALGQPGDILLVISSNNNSNNIVNAIKTAQDRNINVIALTGHDSGKISENIQSEDIEIRVPTADIARIQETHILIIHCICDIIDYELFGHGEVLA